MSIETYIDEIEQEAREYFKENFAKFSEQFNEEYSNREEPELHPNMTPPEESDSDDPDIDDLYNNFYRSVVSFIDGGIGSEQTFKLAQYHILDDMVCDIIEENFDAFVVFYGIK